jgi:hypothetical protein
MACPETSLRTVWEAYDRTRGNISSVPRKELEQVIACHRTNDGHEPDNLIARQPKRRDAAVIECNRAALFELLHVHTCGERAETSTLDWNTKLAN